MKRKLVIFFGVFGLSLSLLLGPLFAQEGKSSQLSLREVDQELREIDSQTIEIDDLIRQGKNPQLFETRTKELIARKSYLEKQRSKILTRKEKEREKERERERREREKTESYSRSDEGDDQGPPSLPLVPPPPSASPEKDPEEAYREAKDGLAGAERALSKLEESLENGVDSQYLQGPIDLAKRNIAHYQEETVKWERVLEKRENERMAASAKAPSGKTRPGPVEFHGSGRVRTESKTDADYTQAEADRLSFTLSRFRLEIKGKNPQSDKWYIFLMPQYSKTWGKTEFVPSSSTGNTETVTSSGSYQTRLDMYEAFVHYRPNPHLVIKAGRQELNFGDQLVVAASSWDNTGKSFDALNIQLVEGPQGTTDVFYGKVRDNNISAGATGDDFFTGVYSSHSMNNLKFFDLYWLAKYYKTGAGASNENVRQSFGARLKNNWYNWDWRVEGTPQIGKEQGINRDGEYQYDGELGFTIESWKLRLAGEYFLSSENYDTFFTSGHKWLGYADQFKRQNLGGYVVHAKIGPWSDVTVEFDYHYFRRNKKDMPVYTLGGTALGTGTETEKRDVASEMDLTVHFLLSQGLTLTGGFSWVQPMDYLKETVTSQGNNRKDDCLFSYLQLMAQF